MTDITVYYWPMLGRAGHLIRMLEDKGVSYTHKSGFPDLAPKLSAFGGNTGNFAPPLLEANGKLTSQSVATAVALGTQLGFDAPIGDNVAQAIQYMMDIADWFSGLFNARGDGKQLAGYFSGEGKSRSDKFLSTVENNIKGTYYFGEEPSYADFFLASRLDNASYMLSLDKRPDLKAKIFGSFPKVQALLAKIHERKGYTGYSGKLPLMKDEYVVSDEIMASLA